MVVWKTVQGNKTATCYLCFTTKCDRRFVHMSFSSSCMMTRFWSKKDNWLTQLKLCYCSIPLLERDTFPSSCKSMRDNFAFIRRQKRSSHTWFWKGKTMSHQLEQFSFCCLIDCLLSVLLIHYPEYPSRTDAENLPASPFGFLPCYKWGTKWNQHPYISV